MRTLAWLAVSFIATSIVTASALTLQQDTPEYECVVNSGNSCNQEFNYCIGSIGFCTSCTDSVAIHDKCGGVLGPCHTGYDLGGCGTKMTATCDFQGFCQNWTGSGNRCNRVQCQ